MGIDLLLEPLGQSWGVIQTISNCSLKKENSNFGVLVK